MGRLIYVVGEPGSGKSTAVDRALVGPVADVAIPFRHRIDSEGVRVLGPGGLPFGGTDRLSMSVQPRALGWLAGELPDVVLGEGDRLANLSFLVAASEIGYETVLVRLSVPPEVAELRRVQRAATFDLAPQRASWVKGRRTKVANLIERWGGDLATIDGTLPRREVSAELRSIIRNGVLGR